MACPQRLFAQRGTISGRVLTDKPERPIADARIGVRTRGLATRSDSSGRFRLKDIPAGEYVVVIRALGFDSLVATLRLAPNDVVDVDFLLTRTAQALAPVGHRERNLRVQRRAQWHSRRKKRGR